MNGKGYFLIPFAINDPSGKWELLFTDISTGINKKINISIPHHPSSSIIR
jgi:hypothetical protein